MDEKDRYLSASKAARHFGVSPSTIRKWDTNGFIKTYRINGSLIGHRRFDILSFTGKIKQSDSQKNQNDNKQKINTKGAIYSRVSSSHQQNDLARQIDFLQKLYPQHQSFKDIGSGINFKRANFLKLIERSIAGDFTEIVVAHKDRFTRFGFEFFEWLLHQYGVKLIILDDQNHKSPEQELAEDLLSIVHVFSCRQNGRRKYKTIETENETKTND